MLRNKLFTKWSGTFIVAGLCVLVLADTVMGDIRSGTTSNVEWYVKVSSLAYDPTYECTESYHQYYIQNNSDLHLKFTFEFSHKVYRVLSNDQEQFVTNDTIDQAATPGADTLDNGEDDINWWWNMVDMSGYSGKYKIKAYTQLRLRKLQDGQETSLFSTPRANEVSSVFSL